MMNRAALIAVGLAALALPAPAYIETPSTQAALVKESAVVVRGAVDAVSPEKKVLLLKVAKPVKGKTAYDRVRIDLSAAEAWQADAALKSAVVGTPVTVFYTLVENSDRAAFSMIYLNRLFLKAKAGEAAWTFLNLEVAMNKVFLGTPEELADLVAKVVSGRAKAPAPNAFRPWTRELIAALPPPPKEGEAWPAFDPAAVFQAAK
jgi:hypothetical protein